jgi:hypothetical protein
VLPVLAQSGVLSRLYGALEALPGQAQTASLPRPVPQNAP